MISCILKAKQLLAASRYATWVDRIVSEHFTLKGRALVETMRFVPGVCSSQVAHGVCEVPSMKVLTGGRMNERSRG